MADLSVTPVGAGIKPVPGMSLAEMMQMARGAQEYQAQAEILPESITQAKQKTQSEASDLRLKMQKEKEYQTLIQQLERNPRLFQDENGRFDINKVYEQMPKIAPLLGPELITKYQDLAKSQSDVDKSITNLTQENREIVGRSLVGLGLEGKTKKQDFTNAFTDLQTQFQGNKPMQAAIANIKNYVEKLPEDANIGPAAISYGMRMLPVDKLKEFFPQLKTISTDAATFAGVQTQPITGAAPTMQVGEAPIAVSMARPSDLVELTSQKDIRGIPLLSVKDAKTGIPAFYPIDQIPSNVTVPANVRDAIGNIRSQAAPAAAPPAATRAPTATAGREPASIQFIPPGETVESQTNYRNQTLQSRDQVGRAREALDSIANIRYSLDKALTGDYTGAAAAAQSVFAQITSSKKEEYAASMRNIVKKELQELANLKSAFRGTRFAGEVQNVVDSLATVESNPTAIAKVLKSVETLANHTINYSSGLDKVVMRNPKNYFAKPEFDSRMAEAYDPLALGLKIAYDRGGKKEVDKYTKEKNINLSQQQKLLGKLERYKALVDGDMDKYDSLLSQQSRQGQAR
jgi:hypothetical protein